MVVHRVVWQMIGKINTLKSNSPYGWLRQIHSSTSYDIIYPSFDTKKKTENSLIVITLLLWKTYFENFSLFFDSSGPHLPTPSDMISARQRSATKCCVVPYTNAVGFEGESRISIVLPKYS